jgi:hypothetical protein
MSSQRRIIDPADECFRVARLTSDAEIQVKLIAMARDRADAAIKGPHRSSQGQQPERSPKSKRGERSR